MTNQHLPLLESGALAAAVVLTASLAALPTFGAASESDQGIQDGLSLLRGALFRLELEAGPEALVAIEDGATLASRLAPRHLAAIPENPVNQMATVRVMPKGWGRPVFNGTSGWVFVPDTGEIRANLTSLDADGKPYAEY